MATSTFGAVPTAMVVALPGTVMAMLRRVGVVVAGGVAAEPPPPPPPQAANTASRATIGTCSTDENLKFFMMIQFHSESLRCRPPEMTAILNQCSRMGPVRIAGAGPN